METTSELKLNVYESGTRTQPAILFLHGSPLSGRMWQPQLEALKEFHCIAPDLPEHGKSAAIAPFDMQDTVRRLVALIKASTPDGRAHVVGLSFGGVVAQALLDQAPEVCDHVILSGTSARGGKTFLAILKIYLDLNKPFLALLPPKWIAALFNWQFGIPKQYAPMLAEDVGAIKGEALSRLVYSTYGDIVTPPAPRSPVLVAVGQKETPAAKMMARRLHKAIAGSKGVVAPKATHVWNMQQPELFNAVVRAWVHDEELPKELLAL
jgi:pimeloyl-ACP methyl ester carboxylesterase